MYTKYIMRNKSCTSILGQIISLGGLILLLVLFNSVVHAADSLYSYSANKQKQKKQSRWTLAGWMAQKRKISLMNQWLLANRNNNKYLFESYIGADHTRNDVFLNNGDSKINSYIVNRGHLAFYIFFIGFEGVMQDSEEGYQETKASFNLRLLGSSQQSTNITLKYGLWDQATDTEKFQGNFYEAELTLYLTHYFGLYTNYSQFLEAESDLLRQQKSLRQESGAFVDIGSLRLYGHWFREATDIVEVDSSSNAYRREGVLGGMKWFF